MRLLTESEAKEAAMNGATVRLRLSPPYLTCLLCGGDGSSLHPFSMDCGAEHLAGWEIVSSEPRPAGTERRGTAYTDEEWEHLGAELFPAPAPVQADADSGAANPPHKQEGRTDDGEA